MTPFIAYLQEHRMFAILRGIHGEKLLRTAEALLVGGVAAVELPLDRSGVCPDAQIAEELARLRQVFGDALHLGAGTVLWPEQAELVQAAGGEYAVSPNTDPTVIARAKALGLVSIPGALTPTEVAKALAAGADFVKLFPADLFGPAYVKALAAPFPEARFCAAGGVTTENLPAFFEAGCACAAIGAAVADPQRIAAGDWAGLTENAGALCALAEGRL